jgi:F0F1-type ATP synthase assembly protein I
LLPLEAPNNRARVIAPLKTKPIRTVLLWQLVATLAVAAIAGLWAGAQGAVSAMLGGGVNVAAGVAYAFVGGIGLGSRPVPDVGTSLMAMFRAEAAKILVIVGGLWLALSSYGNLVPAAFFTAFVITVVVFSMAFFVRD